MRRTAGVALIASLACLSTPPPAAAALPEKRMRFTVSTTGDVLTSEPVLEAAQVDREPGSYDFAPLLAPVASALRGADLRLCHQEVVLGEGEPQFFPRFLGPPSLASAVAETGWDACSVASNHAVDHGVDGVRSTIDALDAAGLRHTGTARTRAESLRPLIVKVRGVRVALLSFTAHTNGRPRPEFWTVRRDNPESILRAARRARAAGADAVIVNVHRGRDYTLRPDAEHRRRVRRLVADPAITAVIGQGAHRTWPIRFIGGKPVVFGTGNLLGSREPRGLPGRTELIHGIVARLRFVAGPGGVRVDRVRYVPLSLGPDFVARPVGSALAAGDGDEGLLRATYRRIVRAAGRSRRVAPIPAHLPRALEAPRYPPQTIKSGFRDPDRRGRRNRNVSWEETGTVRQPGSMR